MRVLRSQNESVSMPKRRTVDEESELESPVHSDAEDCSDEAPFSATNRVQKDLEMIRLAWEKARKTNKERRQSRENAPGSIMCNAIHNHLGQPRKHENIMIAMAGPYNGLVGKHTETYSSDGIFISAVYVPRELASLFGIEVGNLVDVAEHDLDWYDDVYSQGGPLV